MLTDFAVPPGLEPESRTQEVGWRAGRWDAAGLARLATRLSEQGSRALAAVGREGLLAAWGETVEAFRDPGGRQRRELAHPLATLCRLSPEGLAAGLEAVLGGVRRPAAEALLASTDGAAGPAGDAVLRPALVILAANLPALAVQPLLPALLVGRPVILKSPSAEPLFAPAFVAALARREPRLGEAVAALTWPGGAAELEAPLLAAAKVVLAYGEKATLADLRRRLEREPGGGEKLIGYGPKTSLAAVAPGGDLGAIARGLARDVALFDQRGCLSIAAVYALGDAAFAAAVARELARALAREAERLPPGPIEAAAAAAVQQLRAEAELRELFQPPLPLAAGTVVVEPDPAFRPSPGLRAVRVHPLGEAARLPAILSPWAEQLQGAALAGEEAWALAGSLAGLGLSRFAAPGELQSPDISWHNGGRHPLEALAPG